MWLNFKNALYEILYLTLHVILEAFTGADGREFVHVPVFFIIMKLWSYDITVKWKNVTIKYENLKIIVGDLIDEKSTGPWLNFD